jgi:hypothetical protein
VPKPVIGGEDSPHSRLGRLIESGTGLSVPPAKPSDLLTDPLTDFEARQISWRAAEPYIHNLEPINDEEEKEAIDRGLLRFAVLRLAELALIAYRIGHRSGKSPPVYLSTIVRGLNPPPGSPTDSPPAGSRRDQFRLPHLSIEKPDGSSKKAQVRVSGRPSHAAVLSVLSGLAYHLGSQTNRPRLTLLVHLVKSVYPPIFLLGGRRVAWRQLSEAIGKYRQNDDGNKDYEDLVHAMNQAP